MRLLVLLPLVLAPLARADRLISVPTARKLLDGSIRLESLRRFGRGGEATDYLAAGLGPSWEAEARYFERPGSATLDLAYNVVSPFTGLAPGFALGVQDVAGQTRPGVRAFACATLRNEFGRGNVPFDVTTGLFVGHRITLYVGASVPVYPWLRLLAEHDGYDGQAALEALPLRGFRLRLVARAGSLAGSVGYTARF